jgi:NDP-sugar pyrophosphorylase family protein
MAGRGSRFQDAGYAFPKPLIDVHGKTMIEVVVNNLRPKVPHKFIFIVQKEHYEKYDLYNILKNATQNNFEVVKINGVTEGAACTVLTAAQYINNDDDLIIANSDQYIEIDFDAFIKEARKGKKDGLIMTFKASHPKWSYARVDKAGRVIEVAEKKVISDKATVGVYYYKTGRDFVEAAQNMITKRIKHNNEYYVCPTFNELILQDKDVRIYEIPVQKMYGLGTPEDLNAFLDKLSKKEVRI